MRTLNLGILAHVDAGKTSLTERLLYTAGVIDEIGSVDSGSTQTDFLALERQRGITIKSAVVSFPIDDVTVNLIDTPGHPDFIAEVERVLNVLDGAVLVISAVEGVQPQTRILMRTLRRLQIPTLLFVNKIDRPGAAYVRVLTAISEHLTQSVVPMVSVHDLGTRNAYAKPSGATDLGFADILADVLAAHDDELLGAYVDDETAVSYHQLRRVLAAQTKRSLVHPVFFGSAITGAGVDPLIAGIAELLPTSRGDASEPVSGTVFKVERGPSGEKIAYVRMFAGTLRVRDRVLVGGHEAKVTAIAAYGKGATSASVSVGAGEIGKVWGLADVQVGDAIGEGEAQAKLADRHFAPPTLETVIVPERPAGRGALLAALTQLAEQDPLINVRQDDVRQETYISLYGEVQKEVIQATLADEYGLGVTFRETTTVCIERPTGAGAAVEHMGAESNPFRATVGLRIDPAPVGSGVQFRLGIELGSLTPSFLRAVDETVHQTLRQGLYGWQVTDCTVTITHSAYTPPPPYGWSKWSSSAGDFRNLTPLVLMSALRRAGSQVFEPMHGFRLELPADTLATMLPALARLRAGVQSTVTQGPFYVVEGEIPAARVHESAAAATGTHPWRRRAGVRVRALRTCHRPDSDAVADRPQPAQPQGVPAARDAARLTVPERRAGRR